MAPTIATPEAVAEAAQALLDAGQEPTVILIQERIGGSFTTIKRHLEQWRRDQAAPVVTPPPAVIAAGQQFVAQLWQVAQADIRAAQEAAQQQREAAITPLREQLAEAETVISRLEQALQAAAEQQQTTEAQVQAERQRAERAEAQAALLEQHLAQLQAELAQAQTAQQQATEAQLAALQTALDEQRALMERLLTPPDSPTPAGRKRS